MMIGEEEGESGKDRIWCRITTEEKAKILQGHSNMRIVCGLVNSLITMPGITRKGKISTRREIDLGWVDDTRRLRRW